MRPLRAFLIAVVCAFAVRAQAIEFESGGLKYQALTKNGLTIMVAQMPNHIREFVSVQTAISNGGPVSWVVKPEDFSFVGTDGHVVQARPAKEVVNSLMQKASRNDVIKLVTTYETSLYGLPRSDYANAYQSRKQNALAEVSSAKLKAGAAASAIAFVPTRLMPGQSTDGAVFWANGGKPLGPGRIRVNAAGEIFEFESEAATARP